MSSATLADAKAELLDLLAPAGVPAAAAVSAVNPHDGPPNYRGVGKAVVTVATGGMNPDGWKAIVRIYADARSNPDGAADLIDAAMPQIDALFGRFGRQDWTVAYNDTLVTWVASCTVPLFREDF
jgi:hypothetical protein